MKESELAVIEKLLKPLNTASGLINLGIANNTKTLNNQRHNGKGIPFIKLPSSSVRYTKEAVIAYLRESVAGEA